MATNFALVVGGIFGISYLNVRWTCNSYPAPTVFAGGVCYIRDKSGKLVTLESYTGVVNQSIEVK